MIAGSYTHLFVKMNALHGAGCRFGAAKRFGTLRFQILDRLNLNLPHLHYALLRCQNCTNSSFLENSGELNEQKKYVESYVHGTSTHPLVGKTIGEYLDDTTEKYPDREAFVFCRDDKRFTFAQIKEKVNNFAAGLLSIGIEPGDRVGIWAPNVIEWVITQYATAKIGAILVNINPAYRTSELEYALKKVSCKAIVSAEYFKTQDYYEMLTDVCPELNSADPGHLESKRLPQLKSVIMIGNGSQPGTFQTNGLFEMGTSEHHQTIETLKHKIQFDEPANIQYTSGTTGMPKGATLTHHNMINNSVIFGRTMGYNEKYHRISIPVPLYHCFGSVLGSLTAVIYGATAVFPAPSFEPEATLQAVNNESITSQYGTPTMFIDMLHHPKFNDYNMSTRKTGAIGGSPVPIETMRQIISKMNIKDVTIAYGLTETSPLLFQCRRNDTVERMVSTIGQPLPHTEIKVINQTTNEIVPVNELGELCSRGYTTMLGYWDDEESTRAAIDKNGWFHSGDIATIDEFGYGRIAGRMKDMIIRGGENIYPTEVEQYLYKHPKVEDVQVIGIPDDRFVEEVCAWIKLKAGQTATQEEIRQFCKGQISHFKIPGVIRFVPGFPLTVTGKVQKFKMREEMTRIMNKPEGQPGLNESVTI